MKGVYSAVFTPKENGNGYYCCVPDLPGCIDPVQNFHIDIQKNQVGAFRAKFLQKISAVPESIQTERYLIFFRISLNVAGYDLPFRWEIFRKHHLQHAQLSPKPAQLFVMSFFVSFLWYDAGIDTAILT